MPIAEVLLLVSAIVAILLGHYVMQPVEKPSGVRQVLKWVLPFTLILPEVLQHFTGYTLAVPFGPAVVFLTSLAGYVLLTLLLWRTSRFGGGLGIGLLVIPAVYILWHIFGFFFVGLLYLSDGMTPPAASGRVSPIATYRIVEEEGFNGGSSFFLEIYRNPRWLPFFRREVRQERLPCGESGRPKDAWVHSGSNDYTVVVECRRPAAARGEQIVIR